MISKESGTDRHFRSALGWVGPGILSHKVPSAERWWVFKSVFGAAQGGRVGGRSGIEKERQIEVDKGGPFPPSFLPAAMLSLVLHCGSLQ